LTPLERYDFGGPVTCADLGPDGRRLAVGTYTDVFVFDRPAADGPFFQGRPVRVKIFCDQMEAIAFHHDGSGDLLLACEQRMTFRLARDWLDGGVPFAPGARR
jgi:hypothetical protein